MRNVYDRGLIWTFAHQFPMLMVNIGLIVLTIVLLHRHSEGVPARTGHRHLHLGVAQAREDTAFETIAAIENECAAIPFPIPPSPASSASLGATGGNPSESTARMFARLKPFQSAPVGAAGDSPAQARARQSGRRQVLYAVRTGHSESGRASSRRSTGTP